MQGGGIDEGVVVVEIGVFVAGIYDAISRTSGTCLRQAHVGGVAGRQVKISRAKGLPGLVALFSALRQEGGATKDAGLSQSAGFREDVAGTVPDDNVGQQKLGGGKVAVDVADEEKEEGQDAVIQAWNHSAVSCVDVIGSGVEGGLSAAEVGARWRVASSLGLI